MTDTGRYGDQPIIPLIAVAVLTYQRTDLLDKLLVAYAAMEKPRDAQLVLIVIDNDASGSTRATVETRGTAFGEIRYIVEVRRGIPVGRNRALDEALGLGADAMCFIDDDEYPDPQWLLRLVDCWRSTGAQLIGGPVEVAAPPAAANAWQRLINKSLAARMIRKNRSSARRAARGGRYTVLTNNCLCALEWQRRKGIRFDESMIVAGGSDTAFFRAALAAKVVPGWCPDALVYETTTLDRLSLAYQFFRGAEQSKAHFFMKNPTVSAPLVVITLLVAAIRFVLAVLLLFIPVLGISSPVKAVRSLGWSIGRVCALLGGRSTLYK